MTIVTNFKKIHIGLLIRQKVEEAEIEILRICNFLQCREEEVENMYLSQSLDSEILLRWSKLLKYDFFRIYTQHLILYTPPLKNSKKMATVKVKTLMPQFRKNIYTKEIIDFILEIIDKGEKTKQQVINEYKIPRVTLNTWMKKYQK
ncbi:transposase [Chryseobacterium sp. DT-3]|uniref:transposase n=1 Tax=Chryseobacterium sp. DT-3 TaxID=3396164 RepID=UPI003F1CDDCB